MSDAFEVAGSEGWLSRIVSSIKGLLFGGVLLLLSFPLLWWNEGRAVQTYESLQEGRGAVVTVKADHADPANESRLVHLSGRATTEETLTDPVFGVAEQAVHLNRKVETYQWVEDKSTETRKRMGGSEERVTTYSYSKKWRDGWIDSSDFKEPQGHENPPEPAFGSQAWQAQDVRLGGFRLSAGLTSGVSGAVDVAFTQAQQDALPGELKARSRLSGQGLYIGANPASPAVGDVRVAFSKVPPGDVSVIAQQTGDHLGPYQTRAGDRLEQLEMGIVSSDAMFKGAERANALLTWLLRFAGFGAMFFAFLLLLMPFRVLADVVPFLGSVVQLGLGVMAFAVAVPLTLLTIAVAWIAHRPLMGVGLILAGLAVSVWVTLRSVKKKRALSPASGPAIYATTAAAPPAR